MRNGGVTLCVTDFTTKVKYLLLIFHLICHLLRKCHLAALSKSLIWVRAPMQGTAVKGSAKRGP